MGLRLKFNLILLTIFAMGFASVGIVAQRYLESLAISDAKRAADLTLDAVSVGNLDSRVAAALGSRLVELKLREFDAKAPQSGLETEVLNRLRKTASGKISESISTSTQDELLAVARLLRAADGQSRVRLITIDLVVVTASAKVALSALLSSLSAVFFAAFFALNVMLDRMIVRPVAEMSRQADAVSIGDFSIPPFVPASNDEIGVLGVAFNRLRRSTEEAISLLKTPTA